MKTSVARSPLVALVLCLSLSFGFASRDVEEVGWRRVEGRVEWGKGHSGNTGRPYYFGEESFREWSRTPLGHFKLLERFDDELLRGSVGDYRVTYLEMAPRAFLQPSHFDADEVLYVKEGEGVLVLLRKGRRESLCVREGDVMVIPAGSIVYFANTHRSKWLRVVMLLNYASFEEFFPVGGEGPDSYLSAFSDDVLQAAFNSRRDELERVFERQSKGEIWQASEEQIQELSRSCSRGGGGSGSKEEEINPTSLPGQKPRYSNNHGRMHMITGDECRHLRDLDMEVGIANITCGSMMAPRYTTRATTIAVVVEGRGYFEMACPHKSDSGRSERREHGSEEQQMMKSRGYKQVTAQIKEGSVIVLPAGYPATFVTGNEGNLAVVCFGVGSGNDEEVFLAGGNNLLKQLDAPARAIVFGGQGREAADRVIGAQTDSVFLPGPQQQSRGGVSDMWS
ncbi:cupincin-like isoform X1 [Lolium rigidum]|uniref:cupincin-like isoform X1 n=2 Tax=Lolium rigidum TaxID=89674 RepID=UPI001F5DFE6E|nr:cupincin-like isoform X1 [Lolium rigidum]XP_047071354.1 cupincin-like isoform X1 [Lolium rigidum]XP_047071355.1 cupincin-like isoform X1 [Lolium rigidum]XP_047071356.1 cupincin-like isoform X1 [Lolium rigidum]